MLQIDPARAIEKELPALTQEQFDAFNQATGSTAVRGMNPAYPTVFRESEFAWLNDVHVDLRRLLHVDQEYQYFEPLLPGDPIKTYTRITSAKERRNLTFLILETEVFVREKLKVKGITTFVVRGEAK